MGVLVFIHLDWSMNTGLPSSDKDSQIILTPSFIFSRHQADFRSSFSLLQQYLQLSNPMSSFSTEKGREKVDHKVEIAAEEESTVALNAYGALICVSLIHFGLVIFGVGTGYWKATAAAEIGGVNVALWSSQSLNVVNAVLGPPISKISDQVGRKWPILACSVFGIAGGAIMASAQSMNTLILGGVFVGIYWATLGILACITSEVVPRHWRGAIQIFFQAFPAFAQTTLTLVGAKIDVAFPNGYAGWRVVFWIGFAFMVFGSLGFLLLYNPPSVPNPNNRSLLVRYLDFDQIGTLLFIGSLTPLLMGMIWGGGRSYSWSSRQVVSSLVIGSVLFVSFTLHQIFIKKDGLFNHRLFANRNFAICLIGVTVEGVAIFVFNNNFTTIVAVLYDSRPVYLALRFNVFVLGQIFGNVFYAFFAYKYRSMIPSLISGYVFFFGSVLGFAIVGVGGSSASIGCTFLAGVGCTAPLALMQAIVQLSVPVELIGIATSMMFTFRSLGAAFGTSITQAVYNAKLQKFLPEYIAQAATRNGLPSTSIPTFVADITKGDFTAASTVPGITPTILQAGRAAALEAREHAFHYIWYVCLPFIVLAIVSCACMGSVKSEMNEHIDRPLEINHKGDEKVTQGKDCETSMLESDEKVV